MKNEITKNEYEILTFLKSANDQLNRLSNRFYFYGKKLLELENDGGWFTDYFDNGIINVDEFLKQMNIEVKNEKD